jgi:YbgC/YbaW family acyl-CoA thioester hydrolase
MGKTFRHTLDVRGYELDGYGHVNNAVYLNYLESARWALLKELGIGLKQFQEWKRWPVIARIEAVYLKPTFQDDALEIRTTVLEADRVRFAFEQVIHRGEDVVFRGKVWAVMVNESGRPAELPDALKQLAELA